MCVRSDGGVSASWQWYRCEGDNAVKSVSGREGGMYVGEE